MSETWVDENTDQMPDGEYAFLPVDKVIFGPGSVRRLSTEVDRLGCKRILLLTGNSIATKTPLIQQIERLLDGKVVATFSGARQHAPSKTVLAAKEATEKAQADLLVSVGGGSVIDTTKATVLALARGSGTFLPQIALPTTLSAAEFSPIFGTTDEETKVKGGSGNPFVTPRVVILDVNLTEFTPDWLWFATGARALDHAVETVYAADHQMATDATALYAIRLLFQHLPASAGERPSQAARQQCLLAAWLSFFGVANITLGLSHILGREIGPRYDVPHGYTSAVLLPKVMAYLLPATLDRQALIAEYAGVDVHDKAQSESAIEAPAAVFRLFSRLRLPQRLRDLGIPENDLSNLAAGREDVLHILREAW